VSVIPKSPPSWLIDGVGRVRAGLGLLHRSAVPPKVALLEIAQGAWLSQAMYVATKLRIADALASGPQSADDVAREVGSDPAGTFRLMRALASNGILKQRRDGRFALTRVGKELRSDASDTMAPMVELIGTPEHWEHWTGLLHAVRTGATAADEVRGMPIFEYLETKPAYAEVFNRAMTGVSGMAIESLGQAYDFSDRKLVVDVGGGHGALLGAVLRDAPQANGVLFDQPSVIAGAGAPLEAAGVEDRCTLVGGSFFESAPEGGDAYLLKAIIHDWDDDQSLRILRNIRAVIAPTGKLLLLELVLPEGAPPHPGMLLDLEMMVQTGGRERTASEYANLLARAGFRQTRVVPTAGPMSIVDAVPK
jgi:O-methyltransferase domain/Dimerisation domain